MLALARPVPAADAAMKRGKWEKKKFAGVELRGKTLGLVGLGRIGQEVADARAGVRHGDRRARSVHLRASWPAQLGVELATLDEAVRAGRLHLRCTCPSTPETRQLFNAERLAKCKKGVRIINTARGELIDEAALAEAIRVGTHRRRGARRLREGAADRLGAGAAAATSSRRRTSRRRPARRRNWSASRRRRPSATILRDGIIRNAVELPVGAGRGLRARCSRSWSLGRAARVAGGADGRGERTARSASATTASSRRRQRPARPARCSSGCSGRCCRAA